MQLVLILLKNALSELFTLYTVQQLNLNRVYLAAQKQAVKNKINAYLLGETVIPFNEASRI